MKRKLAVTRQNVADLLPVEQIAAVPQRHAGKKLKRAVDEIVILPDAADARIRVKAGDNRVFIGKHAGTSQKFLLLFYRSACKKSISSIYRRGLRAYNKGIFPGKKRSCKP